jgi:hypothetical protein
MSLRFWCTLAALAVEKDLGERDYGVRHCFDLLGIQAKLSRFGWVTAAGNDTVVLGRGDRIGLPLALPSATGTMLGHLGTTVAVKATTGTTLATSTVAEASGTGSAELVVYLAR